MALRRDVQAHNRSDLENLWAHHISRHWHHPDWGKGENWTRQIHLEEHYALRHAAWQVIVMVGRGEQVGQQSERRRKGLVLELRRARRKARRTRGP